MKNSHLTPKNLAKCDIARRFKREKVSQHAWRNLWTFPNRYSRQKLKGNYAPSFRSLKETHSFPGSPAALSQAALSSFFEAHISTSSLYSQDGRGIPYGNSFLRLRNHSKKRLNIFSFFKGEEKATLRNYLADDSFNESSSYFILISTCVL